MSDGDAREPIRTCIVCRHKAPKSTLLRYVWTERGLQVDNKQIKPGRGGYCCRTDACLSQIGKSPKRLKRVFRLMNEEFIIK